MNPRRLITSQSAPPESYVAYLVDDVHLERGDLLQTRQAMHRHLDGSLDPTSRAAIFTTSGVTLVDFTADREKLHSAVNRLQPYTSGIDRQMGCPYISYYVADQLVNQKLYLDGRLFPDQQLYQIIVSGAEPELTAAYEEASNCSGPCVPSQNDQLTRITHVRRPSTHQIARGGSTGPHLRRPRDLTRPWSAAGCSAQALRHAR